MNVVIVDDEATVRNTIRSLLNEHFPGINILAAAGNIEEGYEVIRQNKPDLVFLDIWSGPLLIGLFYRRLNIHKYFGLNLS